MKKLPSNLIYSTFHLWTQRKTRSIIITERQNLQEWPTRSSLSSSPLRLQHSWLGWRQKKEREINISIPLFTNKVHWIYEATETKNSFRSGIFSCWVIFLTDCMRKEGWNNFVTNSCIIRLLVHPQWVIFFEDFAVGDFVLLSHDGICSLGYFSLWQKWKNL